MSAAAAPPFSICLTRAALKVGCNCLRQRGRATLGKLNGLALSLAHVYLSPELKIQVLSLPQRRPPFSNISRVIYEITDWPLSDWGIGAIPIAVREGTAGLRGHYQIDV